MHETSGVNDATPKLAIFLSYRRDDVPDATDRLAASLIKRLGREQVFLDVDSIDIGAPFAKVIGSWISRSDVLLAVIGHGWLTATDDEGVRRLENPRDYVRLELEAALSRDMRVVPLLIHGARLPKPSDLPESLLPLLDRNALELTRTYWESDIERLIGALERSLADDKRREKLRRTEEEAAAAREAGARGTDDQVATTREDGEHETGQDELEARRLGQQASGASGTGDHETGDRDARPAHEQAAAVAKAETQHQRVHRQPSEPTPTEAERAYPPAAMGQMEPAEPEPAVQQRSSSRNLRLPRRVIAGVSGVAIAAIAILAIVLFTGGGYSWRRVNSAYGLTDCSSGAAGSLLPTDARATEDCDDLLDTPEGLTISLAAFGSTGAADEKPAARPCPWSNSSGTWRYGIFGCWQHGGFSEYIDLVWTDRRFNLAGDIYLATGSDSQTEAAEKTLWNGTLKHWEQLKSVTDSGITFSR